MPRVSVTSGYVLASVGCLLLAISARAAEKIAQSSDSPSQLLETRLTNKVDVHVHEVPLQRLVCDLTKRHRIEVRFDEKEIAAQSIPVDRPVSIAKEGVELGAILGRTLRNYGLEMRIEGETLVIGCMKRQPVAAPGAVPRPKPVVENQNLGFLEGQSTIRVYLVHNDLGNETRADWGFIYIDTRSLSDESRSPQFVKNAVRDWLVDSPAQLAARLQKQLADRIDADHAVCGLSDGNQEKLRLAGQREIQEYLAEVDRLCARCAEHYDPADGSIDIPAEVYNELRILLTSRHRKMFGPDSLFDKMHRRIVTPTQRKTLQVVAALREAGASVTTRQHPHAGVIAVHLSTRPVTDNILPNLSQLPELEALSLDSTQVTDEGLRNLECLKELKWLDLSRSKIGDEGMKYVARLPRLERLELSGTLVTDSGLEPLLALKSMNSIDISKTAIAEAGIDRLRAAIPDLQISH